MNMLHSIDKHELAIGIFIDLSKAFGTVKHQILLDKLCHYSIRGIPFNWLSSYLRNREQMFNTMELILHVFALSVVSLRAPFLVLYYF